ILYKSDFLKMFDALNIERNKTPNTLSWKEFEKITGSSIDVDALWNKNVCTVAESADEEDIEDLKERWAQPTRNTEIFAAFKDMLSKKESISEGFKRLDRNRDGIIDQYEWGKAKDDFDFDNDGDLDAEEARNFCDYYYMSDLLRPRFEDGISDKDYFEIFKRYS